MTDPIKELQNDYSIKKWVYSHYLYYPFPRKTGIFVKNSTDELYSFAKPSIYDEYIDKSDTRVQNYIDTQDSNLARGSELDPFRQSIGKFWGYKPDDDGTLQYYKAVKDSGTPTYPSLGDESSKAKAIAFPNHYENEIPSMQGYCVMSL